MPFRTNEIDTFTQRQPTHFFVRYAVVRVFGWHGRQILIYYSTLSIRNTTANFFVCLNFFYHETVLSFFWVEFWPNHTTAWFCKCWSCRAEVKKNVLLTIHTETNTFMVVTHNNIIGAKHCLCRDLLDGTYWAIPFRNAGKWRHQFNKDATCCNIGWFQFLAHNIVINIRSVCKTKHSTLNKESIQEKCSSRLWPQKKLAILFRYLWFMAPSLGYWIIAGTLTSFLHTITAQIQRLLWKHISAVEAAKPHREKAPSLRNNFFPF